MAREDGPSIALTADRYGPRRRLHASGNYPRSDRGEYYGPRGGASITMDPTRAPELIARDIARRLLPAYLAEWEQAMTRKAAGDLYREQTWSLARRLAQVCGARPPQEDRGESTIYLEGGHRIRTHGDTVTLELTVSGDLAERILRLVMAGQCAMSPWAYEHAAASLPEPGEEVPGD